MNRANRRRYVVFSAASAVLSLAATTAHASFAIDWLADDYTGNGTWTSDTVNGAVQTVAATKAGAANTPGVLANAFGTHSGVDFSPGSRYLEAPAGTTPSNLSPANFTVAVVFKPTAQAVTTGSSFFQGRLVFGYDIGGAGTPDWCFAYGGANSQSFIGAIGASDGSDHALQTGSLTLNAVHAAVMVVNASAGTQSMWLDGRLIGTNSGLTIATRTNNGGGSNTRIGGGYFNGAFEGQVGEARIYDDATQDGSALSLNLANFYGGNYTLQQLYTFVNAGSGAWNTPANFSPSGVPNDIINHQVLINNGGTASIGSSETFNVSDVFVGTTSLASGSIVSAGTLNIGNSLNVGNSGTGQLVQTGGTINVATTFLLGANAGTANYDMSGGTLNTPGFAIAGGGGSLNSASMTVHGTAVVNILSGSPFRIADGGTGRLDISDTAQLSTGTSEFWVGNGTGNTGTFTQTGGTTTIGNWFTLGRGGATTTVDISGGTVTKSGGGNTFVDENGGGSSVMTVRNNASYTAQTGEFWVANNGGAIGTLNIQDTGAVTVANSWVAIGRNGGSGTVNMTGTAAFNKTGGAGTNFIVADAAGSVGNLTLADNTSVLVGVGSLEIGNNGGVGSLTIKNNGSVTVTSGETHVGNGTGTATLTMSDNAMLSANNWLAVGRSMGATGGGTLNLSGSASITKTGPGNVTIGAGGNSPLGGTINQTGGVINSTRNAGDTTGQFLTGGEVYLGEAAESKATWNFSGGSASAPVVSVGLSGQGSLNMSGTAQLSTPYLGVARAGTFGSVANLNGGTITTGQIFRGVSAGSPTVNFNGTTIIPSADNDRFVTGFNTSELVAQSGGAVFDTNGKNIGIDSGISGTGSVVKKGAGVLTLNAGANQTYSGPTVINAGTVKLQKVVSDNSLSANNVSAFYRFDDPTYVGKDSSPNGANAGTTSVFGQISVTSPPQGQALAGHSAVLNLAGNTGDFLSTDDGNTPASYPIGNSSYTLAAWIDLDGTNASFKNGITGWGAQGANGIQRSSITFRTDANGTTPNRLLNSWFIVDNAANTSATLTGNWHHVTATYDANTDIRKLYVDGTLIGTDFNPGLNNAGTQNFGIGRSTLSAEFFAGYMADMLVAKSALTQTQIQNLMNNGMTFGSFAGPSGNLSPNSTVQIASGAILDLNGASSPSGGLGNVGATGGLVTSSAAGNVVLTLTPAGTTSFGGVIEDGAGTVGITKTGASTQILTGNNTYTGITTVQGGRLTLAGTGAQSAVFGAGRGGADVKGGRLVLDYTGNTDLTPQVKTILAAGYAQPTKFSSGVIRSSSVTPTLGLGYADDTTAHQTSVMYTYYGDANLDGTVNALDFNALASNFGSSAPWASGDFNYDGTVNTQDFVVMSGNFNQTLPAPAPALGALVPEPGAISLLAGYALLASRRRRAWSGLISERQG